MDAGGCFIGEPSASDTICHRRRAKHVLYDTSKVPYLSNVSTLSTIRCPNTRNRQLDTYRYVRKFLYDAHRQSHLSRPMPLRKVVQLVVPQAVQDAQRQPHSKAVQLPLHVPQRLLGLPMSVAPVDHVTQLQREPFD